LLSGSIPSGDSETIIAPDATFSINSTQVATIPSGTSDSIQVRKESGSNQIGSLQGQHWRIDNSAITLKDTANNTLSTTNVPATESAEIVAPDGTIENTDSSYTDTVQSGGTLILPGSQINVNGVNEGGVVSVKTIDVNITDGTDPVTPDSVLLVGNNLTIEVPSGAALSGRELIKTGQTTSYRTGDDGDLQEGRDVDFFTLDYINPFGNTNRFTDELGGQTYTNNIVIDWSTYNAVTGKVLGFSRGIIAFSQNWNNAIDTAAAYSVASFITGWYLPNVMQLVSLINWSQDFISPFIYDNGRFWTSTTRFKDTGRAFIWAPIDIQVNHLSKTVAASMRTIAVRTFTVTGTILT
jgi:hypothetical protein